MTMSFRSSPEVLSFVDEVWKRQPDAGAAFEVQMPTGLDDPKHTARRSEQPGRVELWPLAPPPLEDDDVGAWARLKNVLSDVSPKALPRNRDRGKDKRDDHARRYGVGRAKASGRPTVGAPCVPR